MNIKNQKVVSGNTKYRLFCFLLNPYSLFLVRILGIIKMKVQKIRRVMDKTAAASIQGIFVLTNTNENMSKINPMIMYMSFLLSGAIPA